MLRLILKVILVYNLNDLYVMLPPIVYLLIRKVIVVFYLIDLIDLITTPFQ